MKFLARQAAAFAKATAGRRSFMRRREDPVRLRQVRRWSYAALAAIALSEVAIPPLFHAEPAHFWFEDIPAFGSLYGLLSCAAIIVFSKVLGKLWLARPENHYDR